jgi:hypothetical protein
MSRLRGGESWTGEFNVRRRNGETFPVTITDTPIYDRGGQLIGVVGVSLAFLVHYLDDRIQDEADAARTLSVRVVGAVPSEGAGAEAGAGQPAPAWAAWTALVPRRWRRPAAS